MTHLLPDRHAGAGRARPQRGHLQGREIQRPRAADDRVRLRAV